MKQTIIFIFLFTVHLTGFTNPTLPSSNSVHSTTYGGEIPAIGDPASLKDTITALDKSSSLPQKISGRITSVCRKKGCWMIIVDGDTYARVTFKDYGFFVPTNSQNKNSIVYGILTETTLTQRQAKHFARDEGRSTDSITKPQKEYSIVAEAVYIESPTH